MQRRFLWALWASATAWVSLAGLAGCATHAPLPFGNYLEHTPAPLQQQLVEAAVKQLLALYPPGATRFAWQQSMSDAFGQALVTALRAKGYAVQERKPARLGAPAEAAAPAAGAPEASAGAGTPLAYVLDQAAGPGLYRLGLHVGGQRLTRVYRAQQERLLPAGAWVRKE